MKINKQKEKMALVCDPEELFEIGMCLSQSPHLKHRMLALKLTEAMDRLNKEVKK